MFLPAAVFMTVGDCANDGYGRSCVMFGSVLAALIGVAGSGYCFIVSALALNKGPYCLTSLGWMYPFQDSNGRYLTDPDSWFVCLSPAHVVVWNVTLFSILLVLSGMEVIICVIQVINALLSCLCGSCCSKENYSMNA
ncbi:hypothetical protein COCON_G00092920 [Conger conger]|uniref:Uncharacterized protein n=2 Tax=Conger conger TaxID=82655 RepID=A0A9Q1DLA1_CONCO|nr:hypothetical protein COCON_G00092920 [Conger conger]